MIGIVLGILLTLAVAYGTAATILLVKASKKLIQFDDLVNYLVDDVETNVKYFDQLTNTPVLSNAPEIMDANKNMATMSARLDEYLNRFEELTGTKVRKVTTPKAPTLVG
jgi:hypothetical protein